MGDPNVPNDPKDPLGSKSRSNKSFLDRLSSLGNPLKGTEKKRSSLDQLMNKIGVGLGIPSLPNEQHAGTDSGKPSVEDLREAESGTPEGEYQHPGGWDDFDPIDPQSSRETSTTTPENTSTDSRPILTTELYKQAVTNGMSDDKIKEKYQLTSPRQIGGLSRWHRSAKRTATAHENSLPLLNMQLYISERDSGLTHEQVKEKLGTDYKIQTGRQLSGFSGAYKQGKGRK